MKKLGVSTERQHNDEYTTIVWHVNIGLDIANCMNLLSKEDAEDNLMRVCSKDIAAELLEMTFGSEVSIQEW